MTKPEQFNLRPAPGEALLRILETTDIHGHLLPYDYYTDAPKDSIGLARTASLIQQCREETDNCLLFDNGDYLQGSLLTDIAHQKFLERDGMANPIIAAMNCLDYDAVTFGNHEFNYGLDYLLATISESTFPIVSSNVFYNTQQAAAHHPLVQKWILLDRELKIEGGQMAPIRIGVIGFAPPQIPQWDSECLKGAISTADILTTAREEVPKLKAQGADLIIALSHTGIGGVDPEAQQENAAIPLATVSGIDVVLTGHTHELFPDHTLGVRHGLDPHTGSLHGKPAVNAGANGSHLGKIDLILTETETGWSIKRHQVQLLPISERSVRNGVHALVPSDRHIETAAQHAHDLTLSYIRQPVGATDVQLHSYFSRIEPDRTIQVVADAQRLAVADLLAESAWSELPILSAAAPFKTGGRAGPDHFVDIGPGPLLMRHASDLYLFPNTVCAVLATGSEVADWLERSAAAFNQIHPNQYGQTLLNEDLPPYNFDVLDGLTYGFDLTQPSRYEASGALANPNANRVVDLRFQGKPVGLDQRFVLVTNSYRIGGGGHFESATEMPVIVRDHIATREAILAYFQRQSPISPLKSPTWHLKPIEKATAIFPTGQGATRYLSEFHAFPIRGVTAASTGYVYCEIDLDGGSAN